MNTPPLDARLRLGLIGAGAIAQSYVQALKDHPLARLHAVVDLRQQAAESVADTCQCRAFTDVHEMLHAEDLDGAIICTPPATHTDVCTVLLAHGLHVLCEKPLAINTDAAERMIDAARQHHRLLTMASKFRFVDDVVQARALVNSGLIGDIVLFENAFTAHVAMSERWNACAEISGGGVLIDNGTHSVDIMRYFLGPLAELQVIEGKRIQDLEVEDTVRMFVRTESGIMGSIDLSWSINKELPSYISIYGSQGTIQVGWKQSQYKRSQDAEWTVFGNGYDKLAAFRGQITNFVEAIRGEHPPRVTPEDALASVQVVEAAYDALRASQWQPVVGQWN
ncbi:MAG: Gfo/Idh/MocA family oxidoreductase [Pirellulaceae bacterium]|nr:Gfo/Idh/MocA family oxidoreductase [Planctomycetales bacterium]